jgi:signal transduction histidine kinase/CheY-like chemotaxis protein
MRGSDATSLLDGIEAIAWEADGASGAYHFVSDHAEKLLGHSPKRWVEDPGFFLAHVHPEDLAHIVEARRRAVTSGVPYVCEYRMTTASGGAVWLRETGALGSSNGGPPRLRGLCFEVTSVRSLEAQLRHVQKTAILGRLVGGVAHDFNNLLMAMMGYSDIILDLVPSGHDARTHVEELRKIVDRSVALVRQILSFSRQEETRPRPVSLNSVVDGMAKMLRRLIGEDIRLTTQLEEDLGLVLADVGQIEQVLMNLAVNARDAMPQGGQLTIATASLDAAAAREAGPAPAGYAVLRVEDTGCGMDSATLGRIFEPFFTTKEVGKGTGLGLSIVQRVIEQNGGRVRVKSELGKGTRFDVLVPIATELAKPGDLGAPLRDDLAGTGTLLLVEDDAALLEALEERLCDYGYSVLAARSGPEALEISQKHAGEIDLLVTDVVLPEMNGPDVARLLAADRPRIKAIFISGHCDHTLVKDLMTRNAASFLEKPFSADELARHVKAALKPSA